MATSKYQLVKRKNTTRELQQANYKGLFLSIICHVMMFYSY